MWVAAAAPYKQELFEFLSYYRAIDSGQVTFERDGKEETQQFDTVVVAAGSRPVQKLSKEVEKLGVPFTTIGDCIKPGKTNDAIHGGFLAAVGIE